MTTETEDYVAVSDFDDLGVCSDCGDTAMLVAVSRSSGEYSIVPFCLAHRPEVQD